LSPKFAFYGLPLEEFGLPETLEELRASCIASFSRVIATKEKLHIETLAELSITLQQPDGVDKDTDLYRLLKALGKSCEELEALRLELSYFLESDPLIKDNKQPMAFKQA
jgi:hypothetical protein